MRKIVLTGGGTAGHVMPNLALVPELKKNQFEIFYVGSKGIEKDLVSSQNISFYQISTGKLRRYLSVENALDIFRVVMGIFQSFFILLKIRPQIIFSKGGFVAVPVTVAGWLLRIPIMTHESDLTPGLANKIITPFSKLLLYTFPETAKFLNPNRSRLVGTPVRPQLFDGNKEKGLKFCGFSGDRPVLLVMGGSQGAQRINENLELILPRILKSYNVVHLTGKGKALASAPEGYRGFEFLGDELKDVIAAADFVISRAGANSIFEFLALQKPMLLIPLEIGSRGDQVQNAKSFVQQGWAISLSEATLDPIKFEEAILTMVQEASSIREKQAQFSVKDVPQKIVRLILEFTSK